jgi:hypothetical protein
MMFARSAGLAAAALLAGLAPSASRAQPAAAPTRYSLTETLFLVVEGQVMKIGRDGQRAIIEQTLPRTPTPRRGCALAPTTT